MEIKGWGEGFYRVAEWMMRLIVINLLWILFTLMGLVLLGVFPATIGMFAIFRKWIMGESEFSIFKTFWSIYKKEFVKGNLLGLMVILIGAILYVDLRFFQFQDGFIYSIISYILFGICIFYVLTLLFLFPVFVHYDLKTFQYIKQSLLIMITRPLGTFMMGCAMVCIYYLMMYVPALIIYVGVSLTAYILMWIALRNFKIIEPIIANGDFRSKKKRNKTR